MKKMLLILGGCLCVLGGAAGVTYGLSSGNLLVTNTSPQLPAVVAPAAQPQISGAAPTRIDESQLRSLGNLEPSKWESLKQYERKVDRVQEKADKELTTWRETNPVAKELKTLIEWRTNFLRDIADKYDLNYKCFGPLVEPLPDRARDCIISKQLWLITKGGVIKSLQ